MEKGSVQLVGVVLAFSRAFGVFRVSHVYSVKEIDGRQYFSIQNGKDYKPRISFTKIMCVFSDAYDLKIVKIWTKDSLGGDLRYYQLKRLCPPKTVRLYGHWKLWAER